MEQISNNKLEHIKYVNDNVVVNKTQHNTLVLPSIKIEVGFFVQFTGCVYVTNHPQAQVIKLPMLHNGHYTA